MNLQRDFTWNVLVNYINGTSTNMETYSLDKANAFAEFARAIRGVKEVHVNFLDKAVERKPLYTTDNVLERDEHEKDYHVYIGRSINRDSYWLSDGRD